MARHASERAGPGPSRFLGYRARPAQAYRVAIGSLSGALEG